MAKRRTLEDLEREMLQIKAQMQTLKARNAEQVRKEDTRRKILLGSVVQRLVDEGKIPQSDVRAWLDEGLTADRDRALFGLKGEGILSYVAVSDEGIERRKDELDAA